MLREAFVALVIAISDGDTLTVLHDQQQVKIRLAEIDAPERRQPFGTRSRQALAELCFKVQATIRPAAKDRYGRTVAKVECQGQDAGAAQVREGMAWVYRAYAPKGSPLIAIEAEAQGARRGLWADPAPVPPWDWRKQK